MSQLAIVTRQSPPVAAPYPQFMRRLAAIVVAMTLALLGTLYTTDSALAAAGPQNVRISLHKADFTVSWDAVPGARSYMVIPSKKGYSGPYNGYSTTSTSINISYNSLPYRTSQGAYMFSVQAAGQGWSTVTKEIRMNQSGTRIAVSNKDAAIALINKCTKQGAAAVVATAAGTGVVVVATAFIPGVDAVTATAFTAAVAGAGVGAFVACSVGLS